VRGGACPPSAATAPSWVTKAETPSETEQSPPGLGRGSVGQRLPGKCEAPSSDPSTTKKQNIGTELGSGEEMRASFVGPFPTRSYGKVKGNVFL
jgi:hypothetical protein